MKRFFKLILSDVDAAIKRDPATTSKLEAILCSSGVQSIIIHRVSHKLWKKGFKFSARLISQFSKFLTSVEIHPAVRIGKGFFIDHGCGVVIGETTIIGNNVTLYHGVTLGGICTLDDNCNKSNKRHPTICNNVIIGAGAKILGPITISDNVKVGANAVVLKNVENDVTVVGVPAHNASLQKLEKNHFYAYGVTSNDKVSDPILEQIELLKEEIEKLKKERNNDNK